MPLKTLTKKEEPTTRPVKLRAAKYKIRNPVSGVMYHESTICDCNDLNAPEAHFERAQLEAGVLTLVEG